jgi:hypothetical protein
MAPIACSTSALTGADGSIFFKPAGTSFCLLDWTDFPAGSDITVPSGNDYRVGDAVVFTEEGTANIDSALTAGTTYYVTAVTSTTLQVAATSGGTAIVLLGDGGTGTADTPGAENHISIGPAEFAVVCQVREFTVEITREELDVTTLPCNIGSSGSGKYAAFRSTQAGYAAGTGTMTVYFTDSQTSLANRLLANVMLRSQEGAEVKLYVNTVSDGAGGVDDAASLFIESGISISSMSLSVNPDDPTTAELSFTINDPKNILGTDLTA